MPAPSFQASGEASLEMCVAGAETQSTLLGGGSLGCLCNVCFGCEPSNPHYSPNCMSSAAASVGFKWTEMERR